MLGLKSFKTDAITFAGVELANRIRKGQFSFGRGGQRSNWSLKKLWDGVLTNDSDELFRECTRTQGAPC
jgi:hypothetical protein